MLDLSKPISIDEKWKLSNGKYQCPICQKEYTRKGIATHIYRSHTNRKFSSGYNGHYNNDEYRQKLSIKGTELEREKWGIPIWLEVKCHKCGVDFCVKEREKLHPEKEKYYCGYGCSHSREFKGFSEEGLKSLREKGKINSELFWQNDEYVRKVMKNTRIRFTSKGEEEVKRFFKINRPEDEWTFGGGIKHNSLIIVRDLYSKKLKVCIEYDGIWHFKDIKGQLENKQKKDKALEQWCIKNDYRLIRIDEDLYKQDKEYWKNKLLDEAYNGKEQIIKFGDKY